MNILITSGGTTEQIDNVRGITNFSTGRLGCAIAEEFDRLGHNILYVCGKSAAMPAKAAIYQITDTKSLVNRIKNLAADHTIDAIVHAMAVSDYTVTAAADAATIKRSGTLADSIRDADLRNTANGKISSDIDTMVLLLERTPKVIRMLRGLAPKAVLIGFKLLQNVPRGTLIDTAKKLLDANDCDFVLANDGMEISEDKHVGYLLDKNGDYKQYNTKTEIAAAIAAAVTSFKGSGNYE